MLLVKNVRLSYPSLFTPSSFDGSKPKFNATFLVKKDSKAAKQIQDEIARVAKEAFGANADAVLRKQSAGQRDLLKDGDEKMDKNGDPSEGYQGCYYIKASNAKRVPVVDRDREPLVEADGRPYGGCYVNVQLDFWAQKNQYGNFINVKLLAVQFWADGESFGSTSAADIDAFEDDYEF